MLTRLIVGFNKKEKKTICKCSALFLSSSAASGPIANLFDAVINSYGFSDADSENVWERGK